MKKVLFSVAAASLMMGTVASAEVDLKTSGQAVLYYETFQDDGEAANKDTSLFNQDNSVASYGVQLNVGGDLGNDFTFGSQVSYLGTAALEKAVVGGEKQNTGSNPETTQQLALTKIFIAKKMGNTTAKIGRQELPKSLSPFAYSEGWNVFKNTFDAILLVNTDIPDTTLVGAYVGQGTGHSIGTMGDGVASSQAGTLDLNGAAYMLTAQNKSIPMTTITASYYALVGVGETNSIAASGAQTGDGIHADALWLDAKIASKDMPLGLNFGLQGGSIMPGDTYNEDALGAVPLADTIAFGAKAGMKLVDNALTLVLAATVVDGDDDKVNVAMKNTGTGVKTPLYTQMVYNQNAIALDATTIMGKVAYNTGDYGTVIAQYGATTAGKSNLQGSEKDYGELDLMYKVKAGGVQYFAAYLNRTIDEGGKMLHATNGDAEMEHRVRLWGRLNF